MSAKRRHIPELLAPAGSVDAVRAAVANGANAVYLGASMYNARDEGAQLTLAELRQACAIAHARSVRVYLTFNVLIKPHELVEALIYLGDCVDCGIDAAIVQDLGAVRLIHSIYPELEVHGSTQMTVHDVSTARLMSSLGLHRVVMARENTLEDLRVIREAVPELDLETFVHGALCISYSGQCFMSGMISERSANRGSCAQSCRKGYSLNDEQSGEVLDRGFLISARDLAAHDHLAGIAQLGIGCLKIEGRKKKPEYVATVTRAYRAWLDSIARGQWRSAPDPAQIEPLVQIFSRGNTGGMYGGRQGRDYITRTQSDNRGLQIGHVTGIEGRDLRVLLSHPLSEGDGLGFEAPDPESSATVGGTVRQVRSTTGSNTQFTQLISVRSSCSLSAVKEGWRVVRTSDVKLLDSARASFTDIAVPERPGLVALHVRCFGNSGGALKLLWHSAGSEVTTASEIALVPATKRALDQAQLREQLGRLGDTDFRLASVDTSGLGQGLFIPVSELNRLRHEAVEQLTQHLEWSRLGEAADRRTRIESVVGCIPGLNAPEQVPEAQAATLRVTVYTANDAREAAAGGADEVVFDPFLRHPVPPRSRVLALRDELAEKGCKLRLRTPSIVRPEDRRQLEPWLATDLPLLAGHSGLVHEYGSRRDVIADYAVNAFNQHSAATLFSIGASRIVLSIELTLEEIADLVKPWQGAGFDVFVYGRPEGMTIEHCVLSAAFNREPRTCRDLCVQKHPRVSLTDPAGYTFGVATDSACRNRLLHSRPVDGSEFVPSLWAAGIRGYQMVFNVPDDPIQNLVRGYRGMLDALESGEKTPGAGSRALLKGEFTRGHFARAV